MSVLKATIMGHQASHQIDNVLGVSTGSLPTAADLDAIAQAIWTAWSESVISVLSTQVWVDKVDVVNLEDTAFGGAYTASQNGAASGDTLPTFVCAKTNLQTAVRGRAYRGRTGLAGLIESWTSPSAPNELQEVYRANLQEAMNEFVSSTNDALDDIIDGSFLAVVSRTLHGVPRETPIATAITGVSVVAPLGTRRGRM